MSAPLQRQEISESPVEARVKRKPNYKLLWPLALGAPRASDQFSAMGLSLESEDGGCASCATKPLCGVTPQSVRFALVRLWVEGRHAYILMGATSCFAACV